MKWLKEEETLLLIKYSDSKWKDLLKLLSNHTRYGIIHKANRMGLRRTIKERYAYCRRHKFLTKEETIIMGKTINCIVCKRRVRLVRRRNKGGSA